jgi:transcriptional repressor NrdR
MDDDKVVDSRMSEEGSAIRRRRECLSCSQRFTTYERVDEMPLIVEKRSGIREPYDRDKVVSGVRSACKNRPVTPDDIEMLARDVEDTLRQRAEAVTTQDVGVAVLERLKELDDVAYLRFSSVYKGFDDILDFEREVALLNKTTPPKDRS